MKNSFVIGALMVLMLSCVSESQKGIEEARFLLDKGEFAEAIAIKMVYRTRKINVKKRKELVLPEVVLIKTTMVLQIKWIFVRMLQDHYS